MFVVPCKFVKEKPILYNCLESIRKFHPTEKIVIVDSDSEDKSYFNEIKKYSNIDILDVGNRNYIAGAWFHAWNNYKDKEDFFYLIHDSLEIRCNWDYMKSIPVTSVGYFCSIWDTQEQFDWVKENIKKYTPYEFYPDFIGILGSMMMCQKWVLDLLYNNGVGNILPINKDQCRGTERMFGITLMQEMHRGIDWVNNTMQLDHYLKLNENIVKKYYIIRM
jgi:hypothetical protein